MIKKVFISVNNSKLGPIPSVNIPAGKTCRADAPCQIGCYAKKGNYARPANVACYTRNLMIFIDNPENYFNSIIEQLNGFIMYKYFRWHSAGDIVNETYLKGVIRVAKEVPQTGFLLFTKKFSIVNEYIKQGGEIPANLKIIFSAWDNTFEVENPFNFPVTYVEFKDKSKNTKIPPLAIPCANKCPECLACWSLVKGQSVVFKKH